MITQAIRSIYKINLGIRPQERVLVFTDRPSPPEVLQNNECCRRERLRDLALLFAEVGRSFTKKILYHEYAATGAHGAEPPEEVWRLAFGERAVAALKTAKLLKLLLGKKLSPEGIEKAGVIIARYRRSAAHVVIALANYSTSHTKFRELLTGRCGARYASMPLFEIGMLEGSMNVDWKALAKRTKTVAAMLNSADSVEITAPNGTALALSKKGRQALADTGMLTMPGAFGNLPAGEAFLAPLEGTAEGKLVLDWAPTHELSSPVTLVIKNGMVQDITGDDPFAETLRIRLNEREENRTIAELGIGTNGRARRPDNILESEKILGTIHIALGDNSTFGGTVKAPFHQDFVFFKPTVVLRTKENNRVVLLNEGKLLL
ncbi:MAG: aminopeptidase [Nitrospirota bacterium]